MVLNSPPHVCMAGLLLLHTLAHCAPLLGHEWYVYVSMLMFHWFGGKVKKTFKIQLRNDEKCFKGCTNAQYCSYFNTKWGKNVSLMSVLSTSFVLSTSSFLLLFTCPHAEVQTKCTILAAFLPIERKKQWKEQHLMQTRRLLIINEL